MPKYITKWNNIFQKNKINQKIHYELIQNLLKNIYIFDSINIFTLKTFKKVKTFGIM